MKQPTTQTPDEVVVDDRTVEQLVAPIELTPARDPDPTPDGKQRRKRGAAGRSAAGARSTSTADAPNRGGRPSNRDKMREQLADYYTSAGVLLSPFAPRVGASLVDRAESCAAAWAAWADTNPRVRKALDKMLTGAGAGAVLVAHLPIVLAVYHEVTGPPANPLDTIGQQLGVDLSSLDLGAMAAAFAGGSTS